MVDLLVTGASGLLGANLVLTARSRRLQVAAVYNQHSVTAPGIHAVRVDLTDEPSVRDSIDTLRPTWVVHCAAQTNVDWCEDHPAEASRLHVEASRHLAQAVAAVGGSIAYISTDSVFDGGRGDYDEHDKCRPLNVYAATKLAGETEVTSVVPSSLVIRTNIYGWNAQPKRSLAEWVLVNLEANHSVSAFEDVVFNPILVNDLSELLLDMIEHGLSGTFHVAGSEACTKFKFAVELAKLFDLDAGLVRPSSVESFGFRAIRPKNTTMRTTKVCRALDRNMPNLLSGLRRFRSFKDDGLIDQLKAMQGGEGGHGA